MSNHFGDPGELKKEITLSLFRGNLITIKYDYLIPDILEVENIG